MALFFWTFLVMLFLGMSVFFAMLFGACFDLVANDKLVYLNMLVARMFNGINSFPMMAVPFFILAGDFMNSGGTTKALVGFARGLVGHIRGGLAHVNILSSVLFAGLSGSAVADTSAIGSMMIPAMEKAGYTTKFSAAVTAASSVIGPIIPPSGLMILYSYVMGIPVAAMFAAGFAPGLLIAFGLMIVAYFISKKNDFGKEDPFTWGQRAKATKKAILPMLTPVILLGGILSGVFTPTESAAVAVAYAFILGVFITKNLKMNEIPKVLKNAAVQSGIVLLLVSAATVFSSVVSISGLPEKIASSIGTLTDNKYLLLFLINIFLFLVGMILDAGPAILILGPILQPLVMKFGIDPVHFAVVMCVNVTVGLATPPMGLVLFVASSISKERLSVISREIIPFLAVEFFVILLISFVPGIVMFLPRVLGLL